MEKRIFLVHGWDGSPEGGWRAWLKSELEKKRFKVVALAMPHPAKPTRKSWVEHLAEVVGIAKPEDYFVGHSLGCITILRFLESLSDDEKVGGVVLVAGFGHDLVYPGYKGELASFFDTPINWDKIKKIGNKFIAIHSDDDPWVPIEHNSFFKDKLGAEGIIEQGKMHYGDNDEILESATILKAVTRVIKGPTESGEWLD